MDNDLLVALHQETTIRPVPRKGRSAALSAEEFGLRSLARFAMWNDSTWARDGIAQRVTGGELGWDALRAWLIDGVVRPVARRKRLVELTQDDLFVMWESLATGGDPEAESAIVLHLVPRVIAGEEMSDDRLTQLITGLLVLGHDADARALLPSILQGTWAREVAAIELAHPRFGGGYPKMLRLLNEVYRSVGLAAVAMEGEGQTPFATLSARPTDSISGPLVTIIMSAWHPGGELITAVRSIVEQSYEHWELIVTDDASGAEYDAVLDRVSDIDQRIRVIRNRDNGGTYVRRNEALRIARGEFVTFHDSDDWAHPQRLELQVRDLIENPDHVGNIVRHARVTETLSFATRRGMSLGPAEPTIMFRRAVALDAIGFYDSVRKGADREYRLRLEAVTGAPVETVGPDVPLQLMLASPTSLSGSDFAPGWMTPERVAYRTASDRYHALIQRRQIVGRLDFPQARRAIVAPPGFLGTSAAGDIHLDVDVLVIADGRNRRGRQGFVQQLAAEIRAAVDAGLTVALLHSDTPDGRPGGPRLADELQALVDDRLARQVFDAERVLADVVVVRHASAAQGHRAERRKVDANKCVIVEDAAAGDTLMQTFSVQDVSDTVESWFGLTPGWVKAEELAALMEVRRRARREMILLAAFEPPSARVKYEDQVVASPRQDTSLRFQRIGGAATGADVVHGVGAMDAFLGLNEGSTPQDRLDRTRRFVDELAAEGVGLIRTLYGALAVHHHPLEVEAAALLDTATARYIIVDAATQTPDPGRTMTIPFANPVELFRGYPTRDQISGRILCAARGPLDVVARGALKAFFIVREVGLSLRVAGIGDDSVTTALARAVERTPETVSGRIEPLSDAALIEEITAAELVLVPALATLADYQLVMMALAFDRPVLVPAGEAANALQNDVGTEWVITFKGPVTAESLDVGIRQSRRAQEGARPVLTGREWARAASRYADAFHEVVAETRAAIVARRDGHTSSNNGRASNASDRNR